MWQTWCSNASSTRVCIPKRVHWALAIDILQDEKKCYFGFVIPTLLSLKKKLSEKLPHMIYSAHIITAITEKVRFGTVLASHEARMATPTLPKVCLCWLSPEMSDDMRRTLQQEALALEQQQSTCIERRWQCKVWWLRQKLFRFWQCQISIRQYGLRWSQEVLWKFRHQRVISSGISDYKEAVYEV